MHSFKHVLEAVQAGHRPVVQFAAGVSELECYPEVGMWARVVDASKRGDATVSVSFDFSEFEERNKPLESACWRNPAGGAPQTARNAGHYKAVDNLFFDLEGGVAAYFAVESTQRLALFQSYVKGGGATCMSYVHWLEEMVLAGYPGLSAGLHVGQPATLVESGNPFEVTALLVDTDDIQLCGPFVAISSAGVCWAVQSVGIEREGYIADVYVRLSSGAALDARLCDDRGFVGSVMSQLRTVGYTGEGFGRAEMGMQSDQCVVLEPSSDFGRWAQTKGFVLLNDED